MRSTLRTSIRLNSSIDTLAAASPGRCASRHHVARAVRGENRTEPTPGRRAHRATGSRVSLSLSSTEVGREPLQHLGHPPRLHDQPVAPANLRRAELHDVPGSAASPASRRSRNHEQPLAPAATYPRPSACERGLHAAGGGADEVGELSDPHASTVSVPSEQTAKRHRPHDDRSPPPHPARSPSVACLGVRSSCCS